MAQPINKCPICGPKPQLREDYEGLQGPDEKLDFMSSICDRCWDGIVAGLHNQQPVNEAETSQEAWA